MTDYSDLTDNELRIAVAKAQGYRVEFRKPSDELRYSKWCVIAPDGSVLVAYPKGSVRAGKSDSILLWDLPDLLADLSACWRLFGDHPVSLTSTRTGVCGAFERSMPGACYADTPERAVLLAYLAWREREERTP